MQCFNDEGEGTLENKIKRTETMRTIVHSQQNNMIIGYSHGRNIRAQPA